MGMEIKSAVLGFPRIGAGRELKRAVEAYWKGEVSFQSLAETARAIRAAGWQAQKGAGIDVIPSNDFSFYDQVLDMSVLLGAVPARFGKAQGPDAYFAMARGLQEKEGVRKAGVAALEMTKWFDTNYHYLVPEFARRQRFRLASEKPFAEFEEAKRLGILTRPVLIGPVTYLLLGKTDGDFSPLKFLDALLPVYAQVLKRLRALGAESVQMDEPMLVTDLSGEAERAYRKSYRFLAGSDRPDLFLTPYFGALGPNLGLATSLPVAGLHLDLVRAPQELRLANRLAPSGMTLSLGVVDGRNVWKNDLRKTLAFLGPVIAKNGRRFQIASSCSLLHVPLDLEQETGLDVEVRRWLAFAVQKLDEINLLRRALSGGGADVETALSWNASDAESRRKNARTSDAKLRRKIAGIRPSVLSRKAPFGDRCAAQQKKLALPLFPTTTIGSFPQTADIRKARAELRRGLLTAGGYEAFMKESIRQAIAEQERLGLDVLVHGEPERNDMVEYFGEQLQGFAFTRAGWVQSYGTRCVKPPIIYGDVRRPRPMTVHWSRYAQSLTGKPVKGMLTGPITILQWSFVRDDQPRRDTALQIALAIRDEVLDLEKAGIRVIQIDEPAIREGLPLRGKERRAYLRWAVDAFRLAANGVRNQTQIHTHMCYSEFNEMLRDITRMDADVISVETSRSRMELLKAFKKFRYPNQIGPGVYDIHSPRVPSSGEIAALLRRAASVLPRRRLWVNPDCGLKTRGWPETRLALKAMVDAARLLRTE